MRKLVILAAALGLFIPASMSFTDSAKAADETGDEEYFFVMNAASGSYDADRLSLDKIPTVVFFSNRPARKAGHLSLDDFYSVWNGDLEENRDNPPNSGLSVSGKDGKDHAVVILTDPEINASGITFTAELLDGKIPAAFERATLFIDGFNDRSARSGQTKMAR